MSLNYNIIEIFTGEDARWNGRPVYSAVVEHVRQARIAARCMVTRGVGGCYESGEIAASKIEIFSYNMPLKIEVILPSSELNNILPVIEDIVIDGIVIVKGIDIRSYRTLKHLIPRRLKVKDVMTAKPRGITGSATTPEIIKILLSSDYHGIPVVNSDNKPIGMITQGDLISRAGMPVRLGILSNLEKERTESYLKSIKLKSADEIMTKPVKTIEQDKLLTEAVDEML
ncbi:MAG: DUF190 domain-containing protein, partial [Spirochaetes bacterium]|nr:DUF190 domain-containing protein [Spirochaetota bacterium]